MYVLLEGDVRITLHDAEIDYLREGDIFGEMALVEEQPRSARASAATDCRLLRVDRQQFADLVRVSPEFALNVMSIMSRRVRRFMDEEVKRQRLEEELRIGREIQLSLIPSECPTLDGWDFAAAYEPARQVGGDFYDFVVMPEDPDELQVVVADVTGKGVPAALFMASCRTTMRAEATRGNGPAETLRSANCVIALDTHYPLFVTALCARLRANSDVISFANGGHERPLLLRAASGRCESLVTHNPLLGFSEHVDYEEHAVEVEAGDFLIFFTDGITEARNESGEFYGDERLQAVVEAREWGSAGELLSSILDAVSDFSEGTPPADDITLVVIRRLPVENQTDS